MLNQISPTVDPPSSRLWRRRDSIRHFRLDVHDDSEQFFDNLVTPCGSCFVYLLKLGVGIFAGVLFGFLVAAGMLSIDMSAGKSSDRRMRSKRSRALEIVMWGGARSEGFGVRTSDSNFLNSSSFCLRYSSISFWASVRASLTRFVRSMRY